MTLTKKLYNLTLLLRLNIEKSITKRKTSSNLSVKSEEKKIGVKKSKLECESGTKSQKYIFNRIYVVWHRNNAAKIFCHTRRRIKYTAMAKIKSRIRAIEHIFDLFTKLREKV